MTSIAPTSRVSINPFTLEFTGEMSGQEQRFRQAFFGWSLTHVRWAHLLAVLLYAGGSLVDAVLIPHAWFAIPGIRLLVVSMVFSVGWVLSYGAGYARIWQPLIGLFIVVTSLGFLASIPFVPPLAGHMYLVAVIICLMFGHTFARARFVTSTAAGSLVVIGYCVVILAPGTETTPMQQASIGYLVLVHALGMMVSRSLEVANRHHFVLAHRLEQEAAKVADSNRTLETQVSERTAELARANAELQAEMEQRLESQREKERLAEQLQHAQKMEAVGLLAGGVAHDFNNIITAIVGNAQETLKGMEAGDPRWDQLQDILVASDRAAALTRQLLTFARKQVANPRVIHLSQVIDDTTRMLRRIIGADVELHTRSAAGLWPVYADPGHIQQILLNLAVNARDAMPKGGTLTIETENTTVAAEAVRERAGVQPGDYVLIRVTDTGCGIHPDAQARIFEPFFTTKELGKGTGLGLSTVFGIARQSNGHVEVESELGVGTAFIVQLPRCEQPVDAATSIADPVEQRGGGETILVIEDDAMVRRVVVHVLEAAGYRVLVAESSGRAQRYVGEVDRPPDLVLSDVALRGASGVDCVQQLKQHWPRVRVVLMSGHVEHAILRRVEREGYPLLGKPFRGHEVISAVRQALTQGGSGGTT